MSSDRDHADSPSSPPGGAVPASGGGLGKIFFFLILAAGVGLLSFVFVVRPAWLGGIGDDLSSFPKLRSLSLAPVLPKDSAVSLADLEGKVVLVNFWGTWCPPCVHEFPDILALEKEYRERTDFRVLAVSCGTGPDDANEVAKTRVKTQAFLEHRFVESEMPVYLDPDQKTRAAILEAAAQRVQHFQYMPVTLLLDREQRIRTVWVGAETKAAFAAEIDKLLSEK